MDETDASLSATSGTTTSPGDPARSRSATALPEVLRGARRAAPARHGDRPSPGPSRRGSRIGSRTPDHRRTRSQPPGRRRRARARGEPSRWSSGRRRERRGRRGSERRRGRRRGLGKDVTAQRRVAPEHDENRPPELVLRASSSARVRRARPTASSSGTAREFVCRYTAPSARSTSAISAADQDSSTVTSQALWVPVGSSSRTTASGPLLSVSLGIHLSSRSVPSQQHSSFSTWCSPSSRQSSTCDGTRWGRGSSQGLGDRCGSPHRRAASESLDDGCPHAPGQAGCHVRLGSTAARR